IIAIDGNAHRLDIARGMGADVTLNFRECDVIEEILKLTGGRGVDASIEALGTQSTFETALRVLKPGGTLSSLGVYSEDLTIPLSAFAAGAQRGIDPVVAEAGGEDRQRNRQGFRIDPEAGKG
ncbi:zinc-binding dehydrogenase, partial [Pseudomonas aeruginosa]